MPEVPVEELLRRPSAPMSMAARVQRRRSPLGAGDATESRAAGAGPSALLTVPLEWARWFGIGRLLAIAVSVALVGAGATWLLAPPPPPVEATLPRSSSVATSAPDTAVAAPEGAVVAGAVPVAPVASDVPTGGAGVVVAADIVVHVAGAVQAPGIHRVPAGARVADAVAAAGGPTIDAHTDAINLAAVLRDGDRVHVPTTTEGLTVPAGVTGSGTPSSGADADTSVPVSINTATADQLDTLPGVGPATAAAIVAHRETNGPFGSIDALADVRGIGPAKLDELRALVTL